MPVISIDGSIGAGKSTVLKRLAVELDIQTFLEPVEDWSRCLERFYEDPQRWGLCLNTKVLCSFARVPRHGIVLCERSPLSCAKVFAEIGIKDAVEIEVLNDLYGVVGWTPDLVVYIRTTPGSCIHRIKTRGRTEEANISQEYLFQLHKKYEKLYNGNGFNVVVVDGEQDADSVYNDVKAAVSAYATQLLVSK